MKLEDGDNSRAKQAKKILIATRLKVHLVHLYRPLYLSGLFTFKGPFASVWPFYTYIGPFTTTCGPLPP